MSDPLTNLLDSRLLELLRLEADGEITDAQRSSLQAMIDTHQPLATMCRRQIAGEQRLRQAVAKVTGSAEAPESLRLAITRFAADQRSAPEQSPAEGVVARIDHGVIMRSQREPAHSRWFGLFASPHRANLAAVAAVLALIGGAVLFGIFGRTIDDVPTQALSAADVVSRAAEYADSEHGECTVDDQRLGKKAMYVSVEDAEAGLSETLGETVRVFDLSEIGYTFVGAGHCAVPLDKQPSAHLMYRKSVDGRSGPMVSVFIAPVRGCCKGICSGMKPCEWLSARGVAKSCKHRVLYSTDSRLVYFLVCCDESDLGPVSTRISEAQASAMR